VTNLHPLNTSKTTGSDLTQLVEQLAKRADTNRDGSVSTTEFAQFLVNLLQPSTGTTPTSKSGRLSETPALDAPADPLPPCPPGWDAAKWNNPDHVTPKYVVGRILARYPPTPDGLTEAMPDIQKAFPGTTRIGDDKIDIPDVGVIDVGLSFSIGGGVGWWWGAL
jgi:hypothetical protein